MLDDLTAWDIPVTDQFVDGVRQGIRRRRLLRGLAAGGALLVVAILALAVGLAGYSGFSTNGTLPAAPTSATGQVLDGFRITGLPDGAVRVGPDSVYTAAVTDQGLNNEGGAPDVGGPGASVAMRRFDRGVGMGFFVTVLRPEPGSDPAVGTAQIGDWLARWALRGGNPIRTFHVPTGTAHLLAQVGTDATSYHVVITTPSHVVITIEANARFTAAELETLASGITG